MSRVLECEACAAPFTANHSQSKYCSVACSQEGKRASWRKYAAMHRAARRSYHQALYTQHPEKAAERVKRYRETDAGKKVRQQSDARMRAKHPEKVRARTAVNHAIKAGILEKEPCERCGETKVHAHHEDYSNPLVVMWLCQKHHQEIHNERRKLCRPSTRR